MVISELFGKTITNIYTVYGTEQEWLCTAECFFELDNALIVDLPNGFDDEVWIKELDPNAMTVFKDMEDYPVYHVNKEGKSIGEIAAAKKKRQQSILGRIKKILFGREEAVPREYTPYRVEYLENKLKYVQNRKITGFIFNDDETEKGFFLLDNGYVITAITMAPKGIGAGLEYYESVAAFESAKGTGLKRLPAIL